MWEHSTRFFRGNWNTFGLLFDLMWQAFQHKLPSRKHVYNWIDFHQNQGHKGLILKSKYVPFLMNPLSFTELLTSVLKVLHHSSIWKLLLAKLLVLHKNNTYFLIDSYFCHLCSWGHQYQYAVSVDTFNNVLSIGLLKCANVPLH